MKKNVIKLYMADQSPKNQKMTNAELLQVIICELKTLKTEVSEVRSYISDISSIITTDSLLKPQPIQEQKQKQKKSWGFWFW
jgi:hypothetical protein